MVPVRNWFHVNHFFHLGGKIEITESAKSPGWIKSEGDSTTDRCSRVRTNWAHENV